MWLQKDDRLKTHLEWGWPREISAMQMAKIPRSYGPVSRALTVVLGEEYRKAGERVGRDPMETYVHNNHQRSEMDHVLTSLEVAIDCHMGRIMRHMSTDGWHAYLKNEDERHAKGGKAPD